MKFIQLILFIIPLCVSSQIEVPWLLQSEGKSNEFINDMSIDKWNNVYVTGEYFDRDMKLGEYIFPRGKNENSAYFTKIDQYGDIVWAKAIIGFRAWADYTYIDSDEYGNAYLLTAVVGEAMVFGEDTINNPNESDQTSALCLIKYDPMGNMVYAKVAVDEFKKSSKAESIIVDSDHQCIYTLISSTSKALQLDTMTIFRDIGGFAYDKILVKWDMNGIPIWAKPISTHSGMLGPYDLVLDTKGNFILNGNIVGEWIQIDSIRINNPTPGEYDNSGYVAKFNSDGDLLWFNVISNITDDVGTAQLTTDMNDNIYINGGFVGTNLIVGKDTLYYRNDPIYKDFYIIKYDPQGKPIWAKSLSFGQTFFPGGFMDTDSKGNLYGHWIYHFPDTEMTLGDFTIKGFGPDGTYDNVITKHGPDGDLLWAYGYGGEGSESPAKMLVDSEDNLVIGIRYKSNDWAFGDKIVYNECVNDTVCERVEPNIFIAKIIPDTTTSIVPFLPVSLEVYGSYNYNNQKIDVWIYGLENNPPIKIEIYDMAGRQLRPYIEKVSASRFRIDAMNLPDGIYVIKVGINQTYKSMKVMVVK